MSQYPNVTPEAANELARLAAVAPTTTEEAGAQLLAREQTARAEARGDTIRARAGETLGEARERHAREQRIAKAEAERVQIAQRVEDVFAGSHGSNMAMQSEVSRYYAVPPVEQMVISIGGTQVPYKDALKYTRQGIFTEQQVFNAVLAEGRSYDPEFGVARSVAEEILGKK